MAVQLPTFADVGIVDPRSVGTQPTYPQNDAVAEGEAALGKGIEKAGGAVEDYAADQQRQKAKLEQALATTDLFNRLTPLHEQISKETDPAKLTELRGQYNTLLSTSGTGISDPYARKLWEATHAKTIAQAHADADARNTVLDRNQAVAQIAGLTDQAARTGAAADDSQAFESAKLAIKNTFDWGQQYGALLPTQRYELEKKAITDLVAGRIDALANKGRVDEASALLNQHRTDLGAVAAANLEHKIETRGSDVRSYTAAMEVLGGAPGRAVSGDLPDRIIGAESGGKNVPNPRSSAAGPGQFIDSTWLSMIKSQAPDVAAGKSDAQILALKGDKDLSRRMTAAYAGQNKEYLADQGLPTDDGALYLAHFLGPGGAAKVLSADPATPMSQIVSQDVLVANPNIAGKTAGDVRQLTASRVGSAVPIPTGPAGQSGTPEPQPNRTGLPMPDEALRRIQANPLLRNDKERAQAFAHYESAYRAQEAAIAQKERIATQQSQQQMRDAENQIFADVYGGAPKITPQQVATDPRFNINPERRKAMIELINNPPGSGVPAAQSYNAALSLVERIRLPEGDPNKITTEDQVYPLMRTMNRTDFDYVRKTLNDARGPGGERLAQTEERFFKDIGPFIDKSNPLAGTMDPAGKARLYEYRRWVDGKKDELKAAGKNPDDLFNPGSPAYIGKPEIVSYYQPTLQQSMKSLEDFAKGVPSPLAPLAPWNPPPIPEPFSAGGKREGETVEQYLKRSGQQ